MSIVLIIALILLVSTTLLAIIGVPPMPAEILAVSDTLLDYVTQFNGLMGYIFSPTLWGAFIALIAAIWVFEPAYHGVMWILRKIPMAAVN